METLGSFIAKERNRRNLSLRDFAELCDLSHSYLDSLEKGKDRRTNKPVSPTIDTLKKLSKGLNKPINELIDMALYEPRPEPEKNEEEDDEEEFNFVLAASKDGEYGIEPSPELKAIIKGVLKEELEKMRKK